MSVSTKSFYRRNAGLSFFVSSVRTAVAAGARAAALSLAPRFPPVAAAQSAGTYISNHPSRYQRPGALGTLEVDNTSGGADAVAVLTTATGATASAVYIPNGSSYTFSGIADGTYNLCFMMGSGWDNGRASFTNPVGYEQFDDPFVFQTVNVRGGVQYSTFQITLYPVANGNASTTYLDPSQFPSLQ